MESAHIQTVSSLQKRGYFYVEPESRRIKVFRLPEDVHTFIRKLTKLAARKNCDKIIIYVRPYSKEEAAVKKLYYQYEGEIEGFFRGSDTKIYADFLHPSRNEPDPANVIAHVKEMNIKPQAKGEQLALGYKMKWAEEKNSNELANLYRKVFSKYPTPIHDPHYLEKLLREDTYFSLIYKDEQLVSACSVDIFSKFEAAEFTDCATLPPHRGKGLLSYQYIKLEEKMRELRIRTMFSYTRAKSMGMNIVAARQGFTYGGCMIKNSMIGSGLEDMNIWYKSLG
ncbi:putative beta-lysine N-acetyltransferase [Halobacillus campisalis]|uniref:Beta-lysine N-acetyltransferase n=1 Tax=Halobacillus campisalis TaxID=435909 RepID=A0ABW2K8X7_9BACI|nr:putative beta-lysine N-acetyltransferase [Halobacillus campisalis]